MVLVGCDGHEFGFCEDEGFEVFRLGVVLSLRSDVHDVEPRLVLVHRVQDHLQLQSRENVRSVVTGVSKGRPGTRAPIPSNFFYFHKVFGKYLAK